MISEEQKLGYCRILRSYKYNLKIIYYSKKLHRMLRALKVPWSFL